MQPNSIQVHDNLMFVLDDGGHGRDCHILRTFEAAKEQLAHWQEAYTFDYDEAIALLVECFKDQTGGEDIAGKRERIVKRLLNIPTLAVRGSTELDFYRLHIQQIERVLRAAYEVGRASTR